MEYYSDIKRNEIGSLVETWMDLPSIFHNLFLLLWNYCLHNEISTNPLKFLFIQGHLRVILWPFFQVREYYITFRGGGVIYICFFKNKNQF